MARIFLSVGLSISLAGASGILYALTDKVIINYYFSLEEVAAYGFILNMTGLFFFLVNILKISIQPVLFESDVSDSKTISKVAFYYLVLSVFFLILGSLIVSFFDFLEGSLLAI